VEAETWPGLLHGFARAMAHVSQSRAALAKAAAFIRRQV